MRDKKYAIMGDIHSNWEALSVVLKDAESQGVDSYICVGDIVGYNADPVKCLNKIRELDCIAVKGNHDHYCSHDEHLEDFHPLAAEVVSWTRRQLSEDDVTYLKALKCSRIIAGFTVVHGTLDMPEKWGYVFDTLEAEANFNYQSTSVCFHGHTHVPLVYEKREFVQKNHPEVLNIELGKKYFINVGSVGQPRDEDPRASYVIYDYKNKKIIFRRLEYDIVTAQEKIFKASLPGRLAERLAVGK